MGICYDIHGLRYKQKQSANLRPMEMMHGQTEESSQTVSDEQKCVHFLCLLWH